MPLYWHKDMKLELDITADTRHYTTRFISHIIYHTGRPQINNWIITTLNTRLVQKLRNKKKRDDNNYKCEQNLYKKTQIGLTNGWMWEYQHNFSITLLWNGIEIFWYTFKFFLLQEKIKIKLWHLHMCDKTLFKDICLNPWIKGCFYVF